MAPRSKSAHNLPIQIRFETFFKKGTEDECWLWLGYNDEKGYGRFQQINGRSIRAHRVSFEIYKGPISNGAHILHSCDTPACVNPHHLSAGTNIENQRQRWARSTKRKTKLTAQDIIDIRNSTLSQSTISAIYGVHQSYICRIRQGTEGNGVLLMPEPSKP